MTRRTRARAPAAVALAAIASVLAITLAISARTAHDIGAGPLIGINVDRVFQDHLFDRSAVEPAVASVARDGYRFARVAAFWELSEPRPPRGDRHLYSWRFDDFVAEALATHGIRWFPIIAFSTPWASSVSRTTHAGPRSNADFAAYAGAFARRYGRGGTFWSEHPKLRPLPVTTYEVWNEPNNPPFWSGGPDPGRYADLYLATREAVRRVEPSAKVIVGGLSGGDDFTARMFRDRPGLRGHIDGLGYHPYGGTPEATFARVRDVRRQLDAAGASGVPLYLNEYGWSTSPPGNSTYATLRDRPAYIATATIELARSDCDVAALMLYTWVTPQSGPSVRDDFYGIRRPDGRATASSRAYSALAAHDAAGTLRSGPSVPICHGDPR